MIGNQFLIGGTYAFPALSACMEKVKAGSLPPIVSQMDTSRIVQDDAVIMHYPVFIRIPRKALKSGYILHVALLLLFYHYSLLVNYFNNSTSLPCHIQIFPFAFIISLPPSAFLCKKYSFAKILTLRTPDFSSMVSSILETSPVVLKTCTLMLNDATPLMGIL